MLLFPTCLPNKCGRFGDAQNDIGTMKLLATHARLFLIDMNSLVQFLFDENVQNSKSQFFPVFWNRWQKEGLVK